MTDSCAKSAAFATFVDELKTRGLGLRFEAWGRSMTPLIQDGDILHVRPAEARDLRIGDIVLFEQSGNFKAHRILRKRNGVLVTRGDASMHSDGDIRAEQLVGKIVAKECPRTGAVVRLDTFRTRLRFRLAESRRQVSRGLLLLFAAAWAPLLTQSLLAQVTVSNTTTGQAQVSGSGTGITFLTISHATSGANRLMIVGISINTTANTPASVTSVTYGAQSLTKISGASTEANNNRVEMWQLLAPNTGTATVTITGTKSGGVGNKMGIAAGVITFTGVEQVLPAIRSSAVATGSSGTAAVSVTSAANDLVLDTVAVSGGTTVTPPGTQTSRWNLRSGTGGQDVRGAGSTAAGALPTVTMSETLSSSTTWTIGAISIIALQGDVAITKIGSPEPVMQGQTLTYTLTVTNNGPDTATGVTVLDSLPAEVSFQSVSTTQGSCTQSSGAVACTIGSMASGASVTITILTTAVTRALAVNTATVASVSPVDLDTSNNTATWTSTIVATTAVKVESFSASANPGGTLISWRTGGEMHNLGFNVYRDDQGKMTKLNPSLIAGSALLMRETLEQHGAKSYAWVDRAASPAAAYWLEDLDLNGTRSMHGPVSAQGRTTGPASMARAALLQELAHPAYAGAGISSPGTHVREATVRRAATSALRQVGFDLASRPAVKILVDHEGWYRVTQPDLVAAGLDPHADARSLHLYAEGVEHAIRVTGATATFSSGGAIEFYGTGIDTPYSGQRVYWLTWGGKPGLRISDLPEASAGPLAKSFFQNIELKPRTTYFAVLLRDDGNNFFGSLVSPVADTETLDLANLAAGEGKLSVTLQGVTEAQQHDVTVAMNGATLGEVVFKDQQSGHADLTVPSGVLVSGSNTVTLTSQLGDNDLSLVDTIDLSFPHTFTAESDWLKFTADAGSAIQIAGFSRPPARLLDITNPVQPSAVEFTFSAVTGGYALKASVPWGGPGEHTLLALSDDQMAHSAGLSWHSPSRLHAVQPGAVYVIVTAPQFANELRPLADLHKSEGRSVAMVNVDSIYDEFNFGEHSPFALRSFLKTATSAWVAKPHYLVLAGDASVDPRDYLGFGFFDFVPTRIVPTAELMTASDDWFSDFNHTGFATIATGRLPARTAAEAKTMVSKVLAYTSASPGAWSTHSMLVAGVDDPPVSFSQESAAIEKLLPKNLTASEVFAGVLGTGPARQQVLDGINSGQLLVNYDGHGSVQLWANNLLDDAAASTLSNGNKLPVFVLMNCLNGFFHDVFTQSLAESLMLAPNGGGVAVWASSGLTNPIAQFQMDRAFIQTIFAHPGTTLGDAVLAAKAGISDSDVRKTFIFFGDPATSLTSQAKPAETEFTSRSRASSQAARTLRTKPSP